MITNHHCSVIRLNSNGILIEGEARTGKSSLLMNLLERAKLQKIPAEFVCDDQALLSAESGRLIATAPATIAGKIEISGFGIIDFPNIKYTKIDLIVRLAPDEDVERMPVAQHTQMLGTQIKCIKVPQRHENQAARIVLASCNLF